RLQGRPRHRLREPRACGRRYRRRREVIHAPQGDARGNALALREVSLTFGNRSNPGTRGLRVTQWDVCAGAHVAVCGPSGSGKTTLIDALAGLRRVDSGRILWGALELSQLSQSLLDKWRLDCVGLVFQQFNLFSRLSALENVLLPYRFTAWSPPADARARALALLDDAGVTAKRVVADLSRGEMQRVAIVRALVRKPAIVLADEPTASLDRKTGIDITKLMRALCRQTHATLIVATHDRALADALDDVRDIEDGTLVSTARAAIA